MGNQCPQGGKSGRRSRDPPNAVSRAYYAMMHAANAALATKGL